MRADHLFVLFVGSVVAVSGGDALTDALEDLTTLLRRALFLADLPLVHVHAARWDAFRRLSTVSYAELMGDHAVVPMKTLALDSPEIEQGSLYVLDSRRKPNLVRPFLTGRNCPACGNWSTFAIDKVQGKSCILKSLEHVGLLPGPLSMEPST